MFLLSVFSTARAQDNAPVYIEGEPVMLDAPANLGDNFENDVVFGKKYFSELKAGDKIRVLLTEVKAGAQIEIDFKFNNAAWTWTTYVPYTDLAADAKSFEFTVDDKVIDDETVTAADFIDGLQVRDGMYVKGKHASVTGMQILKLDDGIDPYADYIPGDVVTLDHPMSWSDYSIPEKEFAKIKVGDKVRLLFSEVGSDPQLQLAIKQDNSSWTWTEFIQSAVRGDKFEFDVTGYTYKNKEYSAELILAGLKAHGLWLKGQQSTLTGIQILTHKDNVEYVMYGGLAMLATPVPLGNWKGEAQFGKKYFDYIAGSDVIKVLLSDKTASAQVQFAGKKDLSDNGWSTFVSYKNVVMDDYIEFPVMEYKTQENGVFTPTEVADALRVDGAWFKGKNATVTGMQILYKPNPDDDTVWESVEEYKGPVDKISIDSKPTSIFASRLKKAALGDKMVIEFVRNDNDLEPKRQYRVTADDNKMEITGIQNLYTESVKVEILIDSEEFLTTVKAKGLKNYGVGVRFYKFTLYHKSQSGIEETVIDKADTIDFNEPYEIYTVMGVRVSEMTPGAIYIIRQGNNVMKMVK